MMSPEMRCCRDSARDDLAALKFRMAIPPSRAILRRPAHTSHLPTSPPRPHCAGAPGPCAHRLGVVLEHLPGLLLAAQLLDTFPLQVALLGLLEDLVGAALPGPQELSRLARPQHHGCTDAGRRTRAEGRAGRERRESQDTLLTRAPHARSSQQRARGCGGWEGAHPPGKHRAGWGAGTGSALVPGVAGSFGGGSLDPASAADPTRYSLCADSEASRSSSNAVPRAVAGPGGGGMARTGAKGQGRGPGTGDWQAAGSALGQSAREAVASRGRRGAVAPVILCRRL